jgi:cell wall-associated NlpC family hydrolase
MARGDILLVSGGRDFWARVIVAVTANPIHHAAIDLGDGTCISAEMNGVQRKPISDFAHVDTLSIGTPEQRNLVAWHAENYIGTRYNQAAFILAGLDALHLIPGIARQPLADLVDDWGVICSSLVDTCYLAAGIDLFPGPEAFTWPGELGKLVGAEPGIATA